MTAHKLIASSCLLLLLTPGCGGAHTFSAANVETISLADFEADPQKYAPPWSESREGYILHIPAGKKLPLSLEIETPFATVEAGENTVRFDMDLYIYMAPKEFKVSPDRVRWADVGNWKAVKRVFGIDKGLFAVGMGVSKEEGALMSLAVKAEDK